MSILNRNLLLYQHVPGVKGALLSLSQYLGKEDLMGASVRLMKYSWVIILFSKTDWLIDFRDRQRTRD